MGGIRCTEVDYGVLGGHGTGVVVGWRFGMPSEFSAILAVSVVQRDEDVAA